MTPKKTSNLINSMYVQTSIQPGLNLGWKRVQRWLLFFLAWGLGGEIRADTWQRLYVFGDSYSDSGAGYVDGNGPTAVVYLARELNLPFTTANDPAGKGQGLNFAVSGAKTGESEGSRVKDALLGRGMKNQIADFVARVGRGEIQFDGERTLFFLAGGLNDRRIPTDETIANLKDHIRRLHAAGARHFRVALLPTKIRSFAEVGIRLNPALATIPATLQLEGATIQLSHWGEYFDEVMQEPGRYGITNTKDACAGRALFDEDATPKGDPDAYYFYHAGHPSTAVHRAVGRALAAEIRGAGADWPLPPGFTQTRGGDGGKTVYVTTLAANGPGSLAEAVATAGARVIEFSVAGSIDLGGSVIKVVEPHLTLAGETAPSPGITLVNGGLDIRTHDIIVRHLRVRPTDGRTDETVSILLDCLRTGQSAHDIIIDHCSFAWGTNKNLSLSGPRLEGATSEDWRKNTTHRITISQCLIAENVHPVGLDSKAVLVHDNVTGVSMYGNLYVSNDDRHPLFKGGARGAVVNNFFYNPGMRLVQFGFVSGQWAGHAPQRAAITMVGNVGRKGPSSVAELAIFEIWPEQGPCDFYLRDNLLLDAKGAALSAAPMFRDSAMRLVPFEPTGETRQVSEPPLWPPGLRARPANEVPAWVLANVGARPWDRDAIDQRFVQEAETGGGQIRHFPVGPGKPSRTEP